MFYASQETGSARPASRPRARRRPRARALLGILGLLALALHSPAPVRADPPGGTAGWSQTFDDEFNESSLDTTKWSPEWTWVWGDGSYGGWQDYTGFNGNVAGYPSTNATLDGNGLSLRSAREPYTDNKGNPHSYTSGVVSTDGHFWQKYGYFEANVQVANTPGLDPAFWLFARDHNIGGGTTQTNQWAQELDVAEIPCGSNWNGDYLNTGVIAQSNSNIDPLPLSSLLPAPSGTAVGAAYHTFGVDWEPNSVTWYVDGQFVRSESQYVPQEEMYAMVSNELERDVPPGNWFGDPDTSPAYPVYTHARWVRIWQKLPEAAFNGPHTLPGTVQCEDYDTGGEGVAYHVSSASNGGQSGYRADNNGDIHSGAGPNGNNAAVGWSYAGDWYKYSVSVAQAGPYTAAFQVCSAGTGGTFHLEDEGGNNLSGSLSVPDTGGWGGWQVVTSPAFTLSAGAHTLRLVEDANGPSAWVGDFDWISLASAAPTASVAFVQSDTATQGSWKGVYGADGYVVANDSSSLPAYAAASTNAWGYTWNPSTQDVRALQKGASGSTDRIAAQWGGSSSFDIDCNLTDGSAHQVALYGLDWDGGGRSETVQVVDAGAGVVLDSRNLASFTNGIYLVWNVKGHVRFHVVYGGGSNLALSGLFFAPVGTGALITGTEFDDGAGPWGGNQADAAPAAFDGNVSTFYDCASSSGYVGVDAGVATTVSSIVFAPRPGWEGRMLSGVFEGSNTSPTAGYVTLASVSGVPTDGLTNTLAVTDATPYRWLRYRDAGSGNCNVAEVQFIDPPAGAPAKPAGLAAAPGGGRVTLSWAAAPGATSYHVLRSTATGYAGSQAVAVNVLSTGYTDTGVANGMTYYYQVTAVNANGHSARSAQVSARPVAPPPAPTGMTATAGAVGSRTITVSWAATPGAASYVVSRSTTSGGAYAQVGTPTAASFANTGLTAGTTYFYKVAARNAGGTSGPAGPVSAKAP